MRLGYAARMDEEWTHLDAFKRLYRQTMERRDASSFYFFEDCLLRRACATRSGERLHLLSWRETRRCRGGGLFVETDGIVQYHLSGTDEASRGVQPTKLMMHFVSGWAKDRGDRGPTPRRRGRRRL